MPHVALPLKLAILYTRLDQSRDWGWSVPSGTGLVTITLSQQVLYDVDYHVQRSLDRSVRDSHNNNCNKIQACWSHAYLEH